MSPGEKGLSPGTAGPVRTTDAHLRRLGGPRAHICADSAFLRAHICAHWA